MILSQLIFSHKFEEGHSKLYILLGLIIIISYYVYDIYIKYKVNNKYEKLKGKNSKELILELEKKLPYNNKDSLVEGKFLNIDDNGNAIVDVKSKKVVISSGILEVL